MIVASDIAVGPVQSCAMYCAIKGKRVDGRISHCLPVQRRQGSYRGLIEDWLEADRGGLWDPTHGKN